MSYTPVRSRYGRRDRYRHSNRVWCDLFHDARCRSFYIGHLTMSMLNLRQVEEKRTPLQLSMDELAKKLSIISFGIIGVICVIGLWQRRPWLDMFTIGGR